MQPELQDGCKVAVGGNAPNFTARTLSGETLQLWDYRQRKHVVLVFLTKQNRRQTRAVLDEFQHRLPAYKDEKTEVVAVVCQTAARLRGALPAYDFPVLPDAEGVIWRKYFTDQKREANRIGVVVLDRYGEIVSIRKASAISHAELLSTLNLLECLCPE